MSVSGPRDAVAGAPGAADAQVPGLGSLGPAAGDEVGRGQRGRAAHQDSQSGHWRLYEYICQLCDAEIVIMLCYLVLRLVIKLS